MFFDILYILCHYNVVANRGATRQANLTALNLLTDI